jgi:8-oxo-dGTP diphosphatase
LADLVEVALAVVLREGRVLVARRDDDAHQGGLWEFPGGKLADDELPADAARRELLEETGLTAAGAEPLVIVVHDYEDRLVRLHAFVMRIAAGEPRLDGGREWRWVERAELDGLAMPAANARILRALAWRLTP